MILWMTYPTYVDLETARCLQRWTEPEGMAKEVNSDTCAEFAEELMRSTVNLPVPMLRSTVGLAYKKHYISKSSSLGTTNSSRKFNPSQFAENVFFSSSN